MTYREANEAYQRAWRGDGDRLRKELRRAEQALLSIDASGSVWNRLRSYYAAHRAFAHYIGVRNALQRHDDEVSQLLAQRDALLRY